MRARIAMLSLALVACKKQAPAPDPEPTPIAARDAGRPDDARVEKVMVLQILVGALPPGVAARGQTILKQVGYTDRAGAHYAIFSETQTPRGKRVFVDAWLVAPSARPQPLELVTDGIADCGDQLTVAFHDAAMDLTDLDHDGLAELTLAYEAGCRREARGNPYKLVTLAAGKIFTMTGHTRLDHGAAPMGDFTPDSALAHGPPELLEHARQVWDQTADDLEDPPKLDDSDDSDRAEPR